MSSGYVSRLLVRVEKRDKLNVRGGTRASESEAPDRGGREGLEASKEFMQNLIIVLFLSDAKR